MGALATAPGERLATLWEALWRDETAPDYAVLRPAEQGMVMARGRTGGSGAAFNMGEMTVTRCSVRLADGTVGHAYRAGRDRHAAEVSAVLDALLQDPVRHDVIEAAVIAPLLAEREARQAARARKVAATRVEFFTLVRGEDEG
jgi:alpha-D-ribose 1-methylphosphonate 5-triphosphate synthase subunit PhnG